MTGTVSAPLQGRRPDRPSPGARIRPPAITTVCRGPKPTTALRGFGVTPTLERPRVVHGSEGDDVLASVELKGRRVLLFHHGERSESLAETRSRARAILDEQWPIDGGCPRDISGLQRLVTSIVAGQVDALAVTCQIQIRYVFQVAAEMKLDTTWSAR